MSEEKIKWYSIEEEKVIAVRDKLEYALQEAKNIEHQDLAECVESTLNEIEELFDQKPNKTIIHA